jgi:hypothetical protein
MEVTGFTDSGILPSVSSVSPSSDTPLRGFELAAVPNFVDADPMTDDFQYKSPKDDNAHSSPQSMSRMTKHHITWILRELPTP